MLQNVAVEACTAAWGVCRHRESFFSLIWRVWDLLYLRWCWDEFKMSLKWFDWDVCVWIWCGWCDIFEFWILNWAPSLLIVQVQKRPAAEQRISAAEQSIYMSAVALTNNRVSAADDTKWSHQKVFSDILRYSCNLLRQLIVIISAFRMYLQETSKHFLTHRSTSGWPVV